MTIATSETRFEIIDRNLGLELVRVTEAAAIAAGQWIGMVRQGAG